MILSSWPPNEALVLAQRQALGGDSSKYDHIV